MNDSVLIVWLVVQAIYDVLVIGFTAYLVFWKGQSGFWFFFAMMLTYSPGLYKALYKKFGITES